MGQCDTCGNTYDRCLTIQYDGGTQTFDCFECAIEKLAPACEHCGCRVIGHGVEKKGHIFCCSHCAENVEGGHRSQEAG